MTLKTICQSGKWSLVEHNPFNDEIHKWSEIEQVPCTYPAKYKIICRLWTKNVCGVHKNFWLRHSGKKVFKVSKI